MSYAKKENESKVYIQAFDEQINLSKLPDKKFNKSYGTPVEKSLIRELPSPEKAKEIIKKAGLESDLGKLDQMDLDILIAYLKFRPIETVERKYPAIEKAKLFKFKQELDSL